jgi:hypothetical protein
MVASQLAKEEETLPKNHPLPVKSEASVFDQMPELFGPPALLKGENRRDYERLLNSFALEIKPQTVLELMCMRDIVDLTWEICRLRRYKASIIDCAKKEALAGILANLTDTGFSFDVVSQAKRMADSYFSGESDKAIVLGILSAHGLDEADVEAEAFRLRVVDLERADRLMVSAVAQRDAALRGIEKVRADLATRLGRAAENVVDAQFQEIGPQSQLSAP